MEAFPLLSKRNVYSVKSNRALSSGRKSILDHMIGKPRLGLPTAVNKPPKSVQLQGPRHRQPRVSYSQKRQTIEYLKHRRASEVGQPSKTSVAQRPPQTKFYVSP